MTKERLGARPDFDEWANAVVEAVRKNRSRIGDYSSEHAARSGRGVRRWALRKLMKIAD